MLGVVSLSHIGLRLIWLLSDVVSMSQLINSGELIVIAFVFIIIFILSTLSLAHFGRVTSYELIDWQFRAV